MVRVVFSYHLQFKDSEAPAHLDKLKLFEWKQRKEFEEKKVRAKLEKAYEQEKSKVSALFIKTVLVRNYEEMQSYIP